MWLSDRQRKPAEIQQELRLVGPARAALEGSDRAVCFPASLDFVLFSLKLRCCLGAFLFNLEHEISSSPSCCFFSFLADSAFGDTFSTYETGIATLDY